MGIWNAADDMGDDVRAKREQEKMKEEAEQAGKEAKEQEQKAKKEIEERNEGTITTD